MRERWLKWLVLLTGILILLESCVIAALRNPAEMEKGSDMEQQQTLVQTGRLVYQREGCIRCHGAAVENAGNLTAQEISQWITAAAEVESKLPRQAVLVKQGYRRMPASDMGALVAFLRTPNNDR
jgi:cbb3-type cytochrome oxidase cytochrome c subunit